MSADFTSQITAWYQAVQYRSPPAAELAAYNAGLASGVLTPDQVQAQIMASPFTATIVDAVIREYQAAFGRLPDQAGAAYWVGQLAANFSGGLANLGTTFANSSEFYARFGLTANDVPSRGGIAALYINVYGRQPDPAGLAYWSASGLTASQLLNYFANSQEFISSEAAPVAAFKQTEIQATITPPTAPPIILPTVMTLTVAGDSVVLNGTAGTINLSGADLTSYPTSAYGTIARAASYGVTTITSTATATLSAAGNATATTFDFGTGVVSGGDAVDATLKYTGFTTYVTSSFGDTVILSDPGQNVTGAASGNNNVNLAALAYTGTLAFGAAGSNSVRVTVGGNISGGTITSGGATVGLVLSGAGTETLSTAEYNLFNAASITGGTFGGDTIVFSNAGTVTANANVGNYTLSSAGNTITLNNVADNVTGAASGNDTVNLAALTYTGSTAFGAVGNDTIQVTAGSNISGGTITSGGATVGLVLSGAGSETLSTAEYNLFNATSITGGTFGGDTIVFSNAGTVTANANVGNYTLASAGNTITLNNVADNVTGAASGNDTVNLAALTYTGTLAFGAAGSDSVHVTVGGNISGGTITSGGATVGLVLSGAGSETLSTAEYNLFNAASITGGTFGGDTIVFSNAGTVTANANVGNYTLSSAGNTITLNNVADNVTGAASGNDTVNLAALTYTGSTAFGAAGNDTIQVTAGSNISGGTITSGGASVSLVVSGSGTTTISSAEAALFHSGSSAIVALGTVTMNIADATSAINLNAQENALATVSLGAASNTVNISVGAASVNAGAAGFNHTVVENSGGNNTFNIDNGGAGATIVGASDATHYVAINNFDTTSDNILLTLSNQPQNAGEQNISDSGNDIITVGTNGVIIEEDLGALPGFTVFNATDLASAQANILRAVDASASTSGQYTFVIDTNQGAAIYEIHINSGGGTIDGIQLVGVVQGVGAFNLINHVS